MSKKKRIFKISILVFLLAVIAVRLYLPYYLKDTIVASVSAVDGYECKIKDLDLALYRGAFSMDSFQVFLTENNVNSPFVFVKLTDISIQWSELFKGKVVSEIYLDDVFLHVADDEDESKQQVSGTDWTEPIRDLISIDINRFEISNGKINFVNNSSSPKVNLMIRDILLKATNLSNTDDLAGKLPSDLLLKANLFEHGGNLKVEGKVNVLKKIPDIDMDLEVKDIQLTDLNDFASAYGNFDFERGTFDNVGEFAISDGEISGYIKPFFTDVKVLDLKEKSTGFLNKVWEGIVGLVLEVTENQGNAQTATKIPLSGTVDDVKVNTLETILTVFRNAFIESLKIKIDDSVNFSNLSKDDSNNKNE